ncbi:MAG: response regulator [Nitrospirae bacterium]|nr:response regulator [Nitrospirota bacterium]
MQQARILIIDDEKLLRWSLQQIFAKENYSVITAEKGMEGLTLFGETRPDITLLDIHLPDVSGMTVLERIKEMDEDAIVVMIVAYGDIQTAVRSVRMGAYDFIEKPFNLDKLNILIGKALETVTLRRELKALRERLSSGDDPDCIVRTAPGGLDVRIPEGGVEITEVERRLVEQALEKAGGDRGRAAGLLGISADELKHRLQRLGIP